MTKTIKTSSSTITACPECDSGNLYTQGSEVECLSCGWKHVAKAPKKPRTTKAKPAATPAPELPSIADQLQAAVTSAPKAKAERKTRQVPSTTYALTAKGVAFTPNPDRSKVKGSKNQETWLAIKALFTTPEATVSFADILKAIPTHRDFVGYAVRSGWLVAGK